MPALRRPSDAPLAVPAGTLWLCVALVALHTVDQLALWPHDVGPHLGFVPLSAAALLAVPVLWTTVRARALQPDGAAGMPPFLAVVAVAASLVSLLSAVTLGLHVTVGLALAAAGEELIFRWAVPVVISRALTRVVPAPAALTAAWIVAGGWFVLLPGHRAQMAGNAPLLVGFVAMTLVLSLLVARSGHLLPAVAIHVAANQLTFATLAGHIPAGARAALLLTLLLPAGWWIVNHPPNSTALDDGGCAERGTTAPQTRSARAPA